MKKVIVVHPGKQHSFKTAEALYNNGILYKYITTVYHKDGSLTHFLYKIISGNLKKKIGSRKSTILPDEYIIQTLELYGLIAILLTKFPKYKKYYVRWNNKLNDTFGKKVAEYAIKHNVDAVISYDYNSKVLFQELSQKAPHIKRILDVSIANRIYMKEVYIKDIQLTGSDDLKSMEPEIWDEKNLKRVRDEFSLADYYLVPSEFVKKSILFNGISGSKIKVIPYGVDINKFNIINKNDNSPHLKMLFVGQVNLRKGIHHLLNVVSKFDKSEVSLTLVGTYDSESDIYQNYKSKDNIDFKGFVTLNELVNVYNDADIFVLPSLGEGMALVGLEAMACGLPLLCSENTGVNDTIIDGYNGFVFEVGNNNDLYEKIKWFIEHKSSIKEMGINARKVAEKYTWDLYSQNLVQQLNIILEGEDK